MSWDAAGRLAGLLGVIVACLCPLTALAQERSDTRTVIAFYGGEPRIPSNQDIDRALRAAFPENEEHLQFSSQYLDSGRFEGPENERLLVNFLRGRYAGVKVDLLFATDPVALRLLVRYRAEIFPRVPIVFADIRKATLATMDLPRDVVGVGVDVGAEPIIELALRLRPATRELVIVTGTSELDRTWEARFRAAAAKLAPSLPARVLSSLPIEGIERELAMLKPSSVVLMGAFRRDGAGRPLAGTLAALDRLRVVSGAPIFTIVKESVGRGAVGTSAVSSEASAQQAAEIARTILAGTPPEAVRLPAPLQPKSYVDWRELRRWSIREDRLPPGTVVMFREPALWDQYRYHALAVAAILLLETGLIGALLIQRRKRRRVEAALREREEHFRIMADTAPVMIWRSGVDKKRDFFNLPWLTFRGRELAQELGDGWTEGVHADDLDACLKTHGAAFDARLPFRMEYRLRRFDGEYRWVLDTGVPRRESNVFAGYIGSCLDLTDRKQAEQALQEAHAEVGRMSRLSALGEFAASISHEIRQPLTAIIMNARSCLRWIAGPSLDLEDVRAGLLDVVEAGRRAEEVIQRNRRLFQDHTVETAPLDINGVIRESLALTDTRITENRVTLVTALADDLPAISGDRIELQQVLLNLVANAIDAMEPRAPGSRRIQVTSSLAGEQGVEVAVRDNGVGLGGVDVQRMFTLAYTTKASGTGIGLSISRSIVEAHGGRLWGEQNPGGGAIFHFTIPARAPVAAQSANPHGQAR